MLQESLKQIGLKKLENLCEVSIGMPVGIHRDFSRVSFIFFQDFLIEVCHETPQDIHQDCKVKYIRRGPWNSHRTEINSIRFYEGSQNLLGTDCNSNCCVVFSASPLGIRPGSHLGVYCKLREYSFKRL